MVLRKPYAFLIKYFKIIHFIMGFFMILLLLQTNSFITFFNQYINSNILTIDKSEVLQLFTKLSYVYITAILLIDMIIWVLMDFKKKKRLFYMINFAGHSLILVLYIYINSTLNLMTEEIVDIRLLMVLRDLSIICFTFQAVTLIITFARSLGVNLKQFDFKSDIKELNIEETDSEEFEFNLKIDFQKLKRNFKGQVRNYRYYFKENKRMIIPITIIVIILIGFLIYKNISGNVSKSNEKQVVNVKNYSLKVEKSFITQTDYKLNKIDGNKALLVVNTALKTTNNTNVFSSGEFVLEIGKNKFYHTINYSNHLSDIGNTYIKQKLTNAFVNYLLVYEIPLSLINQDMYLVYTNKISTSIFEKDSLTKISLKPTNLDKNNEDKKIVLNEEINLNKNIFENATIKFKNIEISDLFKINYKYCLTKENCYNFYEPLQANISGSYDKSLIKLNIELNTSNDYYNQSIDKFITNFILLKYEVGEKTKYYYLQNRKIPNKVNSESYYFEIPREILEANSIVLETNIRNQKLIYTIR